ncbi:transposase [Prosthecobacter sp.]|uniref:transposase n=1 Tax=Prosthecobacter sp. TaxID=1965333 RepID=UPI0037844104
MRPPVRFQCLSRNLPVEITQQTLPHWVQAGVSYFFTFRLADSVPQELLEQWVRQRAVWLENHPQPWNDADALEYAELFTERMDAWLDAGHGSCALRDPQIRRHVEQALCKFDGLRLDLECAVIMPNHVHLLLKPREDENVFKLVGGMKGASARVCNIQLGRPPQAFWMEDSYNRIVRDYDELSAFRDYIRGNPQKAGLLSGEFTLIENHVLK